ncbi:hypothetical protein NGA35_08440 [Pseudomonas stutzeri]|nr:hypothetical protein [Stutzerimonas stutzeri]
MHKAHSKLAILFGLGLVAGSVQAALNAVSTERVAGFPAWYQDTHGRALELCLSTTQSPTGAGPMCPLLAEDGFDPGQPIVLGSNFPSEAFWFTGDAFIQGSGIDLTYVSALEAAFGAEEAVDGDQISFARIRIRVDVPLAGTYVITHPYGVEVFEVETAGNRAINMTRDIGIGAPGQFDGALAGDVGPFLRSLGGPYAIGTETFVGDPNLLEPVTGSPFGSNYVRIQGPDGIDLRTDLFAVSGKLSNVALPTPLVVERSTYARASSEGGVVAQQDVFALAPPPPASVDFVPTGNATPVTMSEADTTGSWYGQSGASPTPLGNVSVSADNSAAIPGSLPGTRTSPLVDQVTIGTATYSVGSGQLTLVASSSDQSGSPTLTARATGSGANIGTLSGSGSSRSLVTGLSPIPPAQVTVSSSNGGSDTEEVVILP